MNLSKDLLNKLFNYSSRSKRYVLKEDTESWVKVARELLHGEYANHGVGI